MNGGSKNDRAAWTDGGQARCSAEPEEWSGDPLHLILLGVLASVPARGAPEVVYRRTGAMLKPRRAICDGLLHPAVTHDPLND